MKENKINWWIIIGVALVVAIVVSVITASITGNIIKLNQDRSGKYLAYTTDETYNKAEVDAKLQRLVTEAISTGILDINAWNGSIRFQATDFDSITMNGKFIANDLISRNSLATTYLKASDISTYTLKTSLTGNGTAYACLDYDGRLYRSLTACR